MKKTARRFLSMLLALSMVFSLLVFPAAATESEEPAAPVKATGNAAPAAKAAEDAPSAAETAEEPEEALVKALQSEEVKTFIEDTYDGAVVPLF